MIACTLTPSQGSGAHFGMIMLPRQADHAAAAGPQPPYRGKTDVRRPFPMTVCTYTPDEGRKYTRSFA